LYGCPAVGFGGGGLEPDVRLPLSYNLPVSKPLPLFPLDVVLFPGAPLPLHIYEPRYKEMIRELLGTPERFGVIRATADGMAEVGCTAEIVALAKEYEDGRMDIVCEGRERFEVMSLDSERSFLRAEVMYLADESGRPRKEEVARLLELHREMLGLLGASAELPEEDDGRLTFDIAASMPFDLDLKQKLLASRSERERVTELVHYYEKVVPALRRAIKIRQKAGGNGHVE
jgi:Lon protease-like protein